MEGTVTNTTISSHFKVSPISKAQGKSIERGQANTECCNLNLGLCDPTTIARRVIFLILFLSFLWQVINSGIKWHKAEVGTFQEKAEVNYLDYPSVSLCFLPESRKFYGDRTWTIKNSSLELRLERMNLRIRQRLYKNGRYPN